MISGSRIRETRTEYPREDPCHLCVRPSPPVREGNKNLRTRPNALTDPSGDSTFSLPSREKYRTFRGFRTSLDSTRSKPIDRRTTTGTNDSKGTWQFTTRHTRHTCADTNTRNGTERNGTVVRRGEGGGFIACPMDINWAKCQGRLSLLRYGCFTLSAGQH